MRSIVVAVFFCLLVQEGLTCQCFGDHIQNAMCSGKVVFRGRVTSQASAQDFAYRVNSVAVEEIYNDPSGSLSVGSSVTLWTADTSSMCGIRLSIDTTYLMDASNRGRLEMNACSETKEWPSDDTEAADLVQGLSNADCSCDVRVCEHPMAGPDNYLLCLSMPSGPNECVHDMYGAYAEVAGCGTASSACTRKTPRHSCSWTPTLPSGCIDSQFPQAPGTRH